MFVDRTPINADHPIVLCDERPALRDVVQVQRAIFRVVPVLRIVTVFVLQTSSPSSWYVIYVLFGSVACGERGEEDVPLANVFLEVNNAR